MSSGNASPPAKRMPLVVFKENKPKVLAALKEGRVDYLDLSSWSFVDRFLAFLLATGFLDWSEETFPDERKRVNIAIGFLVSVVIQMKLHTTAAFDKIPGILRSGSILSRVRFNLGLKDGGFNYRNKHPRGCVVDPDGVRKVFKRVKAKNAQRWHNQEFVGWLRHHHAIDPSGIFVLDPTYLPLPENPNYKYAARMPVDKDGHLIDLKGLSEAQRKKLKYTPCYQLTLLMNMSEDADYFIFCGAHLGPGDESGLKVGEKMVDDFVERLGKGVIKLLIVDRGFIDGKMITRFKKKHGIDVLIPLKSNMEALRDALGLSSLEEVHWHPYRKEVNPETGEIVEEEEVAGIGDIRSWENCEVPLYVVLVRTRYADGTEKLWALASTKPFAHPTQPRKMYKMRTQIEERIDQLKNCWFVNGFTTPDFSLDMTHVIFTLITYSLLQLYLKRKGMKELAAKTVDSLRHQEQLGTHAVIVYYKGHFAVFDLDEYTDIIISLEGKPRDRLSTWIKKFRQQKVRAP